MKQNRDFRGVWIPSRIWLDSRLDALDKCLLAEIDSLGGSGTGCFASNGFFAEFLGCQERNVQKRLQKLKSMSLISSCDNNGTRFLFVHLTEKDDVQLDTPPVQLDTPI